MKALRLFEENIKIRSPHTPLIASREHERCDDSAIARDVFIMNTSNDQFLRFRVKAFLDTAQGNSRALSRDQVMRFQRWYGRAFRRSVSKLVRSNRLGSNPVVGTTNHKPTANSAVHPFFLQLFIKYSS